MNLGLKCCLQIFFPVVVLKTFNTGDIPFANRKKDMIKNRQSKESDGSALILLAEVYTLA